MASANTPRTRAGATSTYGTVITKIQIDNDPRIFGPHEEILKSNTSFFAVHAKPKQRAREEGTLFLSADDSGETPAEDTLVYKIADRIHTYKAFKVFLDLVYNRKPQVLVDIQGLWLLRQVYALARLYNAYPAQNCVMDSFREWHKTNLAQVNDLLYLGLNIGSGEHCPLTAYMIKQVAFDIGLVGFKEYSKQNLSLKKLLGEGCTSAIRQELFMSVAKHETIDPAKSKINWHVVETGTNAGNLNAQSEKQRTTLVCDFEVEAEVLD